MIKIIKNSGQMTQVSKQQSSACALSYHNVTDLYDPTSDSNDEDD